VPELSKPRVDRRPERRQIADVGLLGDDPPVERFDQLYGLVQVGFRRAVVGDGVEAVTHIHGDDVGALLRQPDGVRAALPPSGAGDESDLAFYSCHQFLLVSPNTAPYLSIKRSNLASEESQSKAVFQASRPMERRNSGRPSTVSWRS